MVVERLFGDHFDIPSNEINVIPQSYQKQSNPDGEISCDSKYNIFIESKIVPGAINEKQLIKHMELTNPAQCRYLIYLTPDIEKPMLLQHFMVEWMDWEKSAENYNECEWFQIGWSFEEGHINAMGTLHPEGYDAFRKDFLKLLVKTVEQATTKYHVELYK